MHKDIFNVLTSGASFDAARFKNDIQLFHPKAKDREPPGKLDRFLATGASGDVVMQPGSEEAPLSGDPPVYEEFIYMSCDDTRSSML
jgi:hypothetical protein